MEKGLVKAGFRDVTYSGSEINDKGVFNFYNAVIKKAARDHMYARKIIWEDQQECARKNVQFSKSSRKAGLDMTPEDTIRDIERFFRSQLFESFTDNDGEYLIRRLNEMSIDEINDCLRKMTKEEEKEI